MRGLQTAELNAVTATAPASNNALLITLSLYILDCGATAAKPPMR